MILCRTSEAARSLDSLSFVDAQVVRSLICSLFKAVFGRKSVINLMSDPRILSKVFILAAKMSCFSYSLQAFVCPQEGAVASSMILLY